MSGVHVAGEHSQVYRTQGARAPCAAAVGLWAAAKRAAAPSSAALHLPRRLHARPAGRSGPSVVAQRVALQNVQRTRSGLADSQYPAACSSSATRGRCLP